MVCTQMCPTPHLSAGEHMCHVNTTGYGFQMYDDSIMYSLLKWLKNTSKIDCFIV